MAYKQSVWGYQIEVERSKSKKLGTVAGECRQCGIWIGTEELEADCTRCHQPHGVSK